MENELVNSFLFEVWRIVRDYLMFASGAFFLFYIVLKKPLWFRKIQKKMPKLKDYRRDILFSLLTVTIFGVIAVVTFYLLHKSNNVYYQVDKFGYIYYGVSFVWMFLVHDTWFYWIHRLMHHPKIYKHVHKIHHTSTNPSPWTAYAFHPLEAVLEASILPLLAFTLPLHDSAIIAFFLFQIGYNVYGHLGFELYPKGFNTHWFGKWINTSVAHNLHHHRFHGNYGLYFLIWDRIMGTVREDYDEVYEKTTVKDESDFLEGEKGINGVSSGG